MLITHSFTERDLAAAFGGISVESAACFDPAAASLIRREITALHGSLQAFTAYLRLRFLLRPMRYDGDIGALLARSSDAWDAQAVRDALRAGAGAAPGGASGDAAQSAQGARSSLVCVSALSGEVSALSSPPVPKPRMAARGKRGVPGCGAGAVCSPPRRGLRAVGGRCCRERRAIDRFLDRILDRFLDRFSIGPRRPRGSGAPQRIRQGLSLVLGQSSRGRLAGWLAGRASPRCRRR